MNTIELLEKILIFLNAVPNRKYGDNYLLASQLESLIEEEKIKNELIAMVKQDKFPLNKSYELSRNKR